MDARKSMDAILKKYGHDVLLQRRIEKTEATTKKFANVLERHTVRSMYPGSGSLPIVANEQMPGVTHSADMVFYFRWDANPSSGDRIYEGEVADKTARVFTIDYAIPNRGVGGRVEYWTVGATLE